MKIKNAINLLLNANMLFVVFDESEFERGLQKVAHAVHGSLGNHSLELNFFPKVGGLAPSLVGLCNFVYLESLCESIRATPCQSKALILLVAQILIGSQEVIVFVQ